MVSVSSLNTFSIVYVHVSINNNKSLYFKKYFLLCDTNEKSDNDVYIMYTQKLEKY